MKKLLSTHRRLVVATAGIVALGMVLATGIFGEGKSLMPQVYGVVAAGVFCFVIAYSLFSFLKYSVGLRVDEEEELRGLDISEHAMESYSGFSIYSNS